MTEELHHRRALLEGVVLDDRFEITFAEVCETLQISAERLLELIEEGIVQVSGANPYAWRFDARDFLRLRTAVRLQRDLGLNPPGAALVIELLEELGKLP